MSDWALPGLPSTTRVNEPSGCWPKFRLRISAAFSLSAPGRSKRFERRSERPPRTVNAAKTTAIQPAITNQRKRMRL
jgi:hypothetical protein